MKKVLVILMLLFAGCSKQEASYQQISMAEAKDRMLQSSDYMIVDVRTVEEYNEGHIPGAINIPNESITAAPSELPDKDQVLYVYCRSGNRSKQASSKLAKLGYTNIYEMGGISSWPDEIEK